MKKGILLVIILVLIGLGVWYYVQPPTATVSPFRLLPEETIAVAELIELEKSIDQFKAGTMAQRLKEVDVRGVMTELEAPIENFEQYEEMRGKMVDALNSRWFRELFGQEVVLGLVPPSVPKLTPMAVEKFLGSLVVVSRPKHRAEALEFVSEMFGGQAAVGTEGYGDHEIKQFMLEEGVPIYYALDDGLLVGGFGLDTIKGCLDRSDRATLSLATNKNYLEMRNKLDSPHLKAMFYANAERIYAVISEAVSSRIAEKADREQADRSLAGLKGLRDIGCAFLDDESAVLEAKTLVTFDREALDPFYAKAYRFEPEDNQTLNMVPESVLLYYWANCLDLKMYWDLVSDARSTDTREKASLERNIEQRTGISFDDLLTAIGNQFGLMITDVSTTGLFPLPKVVLFFEVEDNEVVEELITSAVEDTILQIQYEDFSGISIGSLPTPFGADVQPAYAFLNDFCLISMSAQLIKDTISTCGDEKNIRTDPDFNAVDRGLSARSSAVSFVNVKDLVGKVKDVAEWQNKMMVLKNPEKARDAATVTERVLNPVLESLRVVEAMGSRMVLQENEIEAYTYIKVDREP
jgi:hypothetical protein